MSEAKREAKRFLGLELAGAKNNKTSLAALEYYPKEKKTFLLDIFDHITVAEDQSGDEALLELLEEEGERVAALGVNVALQLPPCITCKRKSCTLPSQCPIPAVKWMRETAKKVQKSITITPYTQRPVELWVKHHVLPELPEANSFDIDETLGGNRAPLTARMNFLKRHLKHFKLVEVWPKLSIAVLCSKLRLQRRVVTSYRHLEYGAHAREEILIALASRYEIFIYERDMRKLSQSLTAFDAFICALTALLYDQNQCAKVPKGFPASSGWVQYPKLDQRLE